MLGPMTNTLRIVYRHPNNLMGTIPRTRSSPIPHHIRPTFHRLQQSRPFTSVTMIQSALLSSGSMLTVSVQCLRYQVQCLRHMVVLLRAMEQ